MDELIRYLKKISMLLLLSPLKIMKVKKNRAILDNCLAHNYADNIKPIAEYLNKWYPGHFEIYVAVNDIEKYRYLKKKKIIPIKFHSFAYYTVAMSSAFFITNSGGYSYLPLKKNQFVINTWHGGGAYKKFGRDSYGTDKFYENELRLAAKKTSLFLSTGTVVSDYISNALLLPKKVFLEIGMPRNDVLIQGNDALRDRIRKRIGIQQNEKLVLYAPTYRKQNDRAFGDSIAIDYGIDCERVCTALSERFGGKWRFAVRFHPQVRNYNTSKFGNAIDLTKYEDMQELLLAADAMINDYSSSMWDFMLTGKPCFTFAIDMRHYMETTDVYTPVEDWPFPKSTNNRELEQSILNFDYKNYREECHRHYTDLGGCESGEATKKVCEFIYDISCGKRDRSTT